MFSKHQETMLRGAAAKSRMVCVTALLCLAASSLSAQVEIIDYVVPTANSFPDTLVLGSDGALWFTEYGANKVGSTTDGATITEYTVPSPDSNPYGITAGPDGALWFTEYTANKIGRVTPQGAFMEFPLSLPNSFPAQITAGPDGALWFTEFNSQKIGRITVHGVIKEYNLAPESYPIGIATGPDGAMWFVESSSNKIGRITTAGSITEFDVPSAFSLPYAITAGPDRAMWFTEQGTNNVGRISLAGAITEFPAASGPTGIVTGIDGALWFTEFTGVKVGRLTTAGRLTEYPVANPGFLRGIAVGPKGAIWFAENSTNRLGQVVFQTASLSATPTQDHPGATVDLTGAGFAAGESVTIKDEGGVFRTVSADDSGTFSLTARFRAAPFGGNSFVASGIASHRLGIAKYSIIPICVVTPSAGTPGTQVKLTGYGFHSFDSVSVYIDSQDFVGSATADSQGSVKGANAIVFNVPQHLSAGTHTLVAFGDNGATGAAIFTVQ